MTERTYENPGDCIKCGCLFATVQWESGYGGESTGRMEAQCYECSYSWRVLAKDEIEEKA